MTTYPPQSFVSAELAGPSWTPPVPMPEAGVVLAVYPAGQKLADKCCYDVGLMTTGQILHWIEAASSGRSRADQYEVDDQVLVVPYGNGQWMIHGAEKQDGEAPSLTGETAAGDPEGRGHDRTDAQGRSYRQSRGVMALTAVAQGALRPADIGQADTDQKKALIETFPDMIRGPLLPVIYSALLPLLSGAIAGGNTAAQARMAALDLLGGGVNEGLAWMAKETGQAESMAAARSLVGQITAYTRQALAIFRLVMERYRYGMTLPTGSEIADMMEERLKDELPRMLVQAVTTGWKGEKPAWRIRANMAVTAAQTALFPVIMQVIRSVIGA